MDLYKIISHSGVIKKQQKGGQLYVFDIAISRKI